MNELNKNSLEEKFFGKSDLMALPELIEIYYSEEKYPLVCYLANIHEREFEVMSFYKMLALMNLEKISAAKIIYNSKGEEWFNICKQYKVYWKHIILFALYFKIKKLPEWLSTVANENYDSELTQLLELTNEVAEENLKDLPIFCSVAKKYPVLKKIYTVAKKNKNSVTTFEDMRWKIWEKYNQALIEKKLDENQVTCVYDEDIKIYSYKPHQVAASMHIITDGETSLIFDCGAEISQDEVIYIPVKDILSALNISKVNGLFVSHGHFDHYGSLNEFLDCTHFMTKDTANIIKMVSPNILLSNLEIKDFYEGVNIDGIEIKFVPNGHIRGSVLFDINWKDKKRIIYTGDYCTENQKTCIGLDTEFLLTNPKRVDVFLTESTYGKKYDVLSLKDYESVFLYLCQKLLQLGKKIIIPCFAVGRAAEITLLLKDMTRKQGYTILIDGLAAKLTEYYQNSLEQSIIGGNVSVCRDERELSERIESYNVIIASSGIMKIGSTSYNYLQQMLKMHNICVMKVGFTHKHEDMLVSVLNRRNQNVTFFDIPLSAHAYHDNLVCVLESISPYTAIYVHGNGIFPPDCIK